MTTSPRFSVDDNRELLIWWTSQSDCERVAELVNTEAIQLPPYILEELDSRGGRAGRGRLRVPDIPETRGLESIVFEGPAAPIAHGAGGIVFKAVDAFLVIALPGFVTTLEMEFWQPTTLVFQGLLRSLQDTLVQGPEEPSEPFAARLVARLLSNLGGLLGAFSWRGRPSWWILMEHAARGAKEVYADEELPLWQEVQEIYPPVLRVALHLLATDIALMAGQEWSDE